MSIMLAEGDDLSGAEKVFAFFRDALLDGSLQPGERLLGERELSLQLGVSRPLLREALRSLAMLGFLDIRHGKGAYVRQADINVLSDFFTFSLAQQPDILDDVMQARIAIECQAIRLACERATESDLKRIGSELTRLMDTLHDPVEGGAADFAFHRAIVEAGHSEALTTLYGAISELLRRSHVQRREVTVSEPGIVDYLVEAHREVFLSIIERDADAADRKLRDHFTIGDEFRRRSLISAFARRPQT
ncbi:FadR family transcriptional regulator [Pseudaminobacter sp. 19-2017]|uniref:FadR family transcriptional regulator n=1 Tax=Pseudaminobacter soli (ex Zhang et al. 2022) TaxID=2831468 RepID=A0A942E156_9HYPH|nr:FadR/GntR family transcriptional regulator [Pseudaminobacter soli]MBS3651193.1 FadR family transcriptional regulator [Pseudaminobacter soli]